MRTCIVGGGASGVTCAYYLLQKGYNGSDITIMESSDRTGGKINSFQIDGLYYEKGAEHILNYYVTVHELFDKFQIKAEDITEYHIVVNESFKKFFEFIEESAGFLIDLVKYYKLTAEYNNTFLNTASFENISDDINLQKSLYDYLVDNDLHGLIPFFDMMSMHMLSVNAKEVVFGIFLKVLPPQALHAFINYNIPILGPKISSPPSQFVPGGYDSLLKAMTIYLTSNNVQIKYNEKISEINTSNPDQPIIISNNVSYAFDKLILTSIWKDIDENLNAVYIDGLPIESILKSTNFFNPCMFKQHMRYSEPKYGDFFLIDAQTNYPCVAYNFYKNTNILSTLTVVNTNDIEQIRSNIITSLQKYFGKMTVAEEDDGYMCYLQPIASVEDIKNGYFKKVESYQGVNNVYYSNIYFTISYSGLVIQYAKELINKYF